MPLPVLIKAILPLIPAAELLVALLLPTVRVLKAAALLTIWPATAPLAPPRPLIAGFWPARSSVPPAAAPPLTATLTAGKAPAAPTVSVPAETDTSPLKLLAWASVKPPPPDFASPPEPLRAPFSTRVPVST